MNKIDQVYELGMEKQFVEIKWMMKETGKLIECREKNGELNAEKTKTLSTTDRPGDEEK